MSGSNIFCSPATPILLRKHPNLLILTVLSRHSGSIKNVTQLLIFNACVKGPMCLRDPSISPMWLQGTQLFLNILGLDCRREQTLFRDAHRHRLGLWGGADLPLGIVDTTCL